MTYDTNAPPIIGYDVVIPVLRGYEPATVLPDPSSYSLMSIVQDLVSIIDWTLSDRDVSRIHVMGHDWGAALADLLAAHYGDKIASLVTVAVPHNPIYGFNKYPWQVNALLLFLLPSTPPHSRSMPLSSLNRHTVSQFLVHDLLPATHHP